MRHVTLPHLVVLLLPSLLSAQARASGTRVSVEVVGVAGISRGEPVVRAYSTAGAEVARLRVPSGQWRTMILPRGIYVFSLDTIATDSLTVGARIFAPASSEEREVGAAPVRIQLRAKPITATVVLVPSGLPEGSATEIVMEDPLMRVYRTSDGEVSSSNISPAQGRQPKPPMGQSVRIPLLAAGSWTLRASAPQLRLARPGETAYCPRLKQQEVQLQAGVVNRIEVAFVVVKNMTGVGGDACP
jgi:hypothetical protein